MVNMLGELKLKHVWRGAVLALLLAALMGPWWFDRIFVPAEYPCNRPVVRLEGDFCGVPMPGTWIFLALAGRSIELALGLFSGASVIPDSGSGFLSILLFTLLALLLVLPFFSTILLILNRNRRCWQTFQIAAWGLAVAVSLLVGLEQIGLKGSWVLWGIWLYIGLATAALVAEALMLAADNRRLG
jgi:hypothetical protein